MSTIESFAEYSFYDLINLYKSILFKSPYLFTMTKINILC